MTYSEKLKDPRWQKKRLEIMQRDEFKCVWCGNDKMTLHVHHLTYVNVDPWDYENNFMITLCEDCHAQEHAHGKIVDEELLLYIKRYAPNVRVIIKPLLENIIDSLSLISEKYRWVAFNQIYSSPERKEILKISGQLYHEPEEYERIHELVEIIKCKELTEENNDRIEILKRKEKK